MATENFSEPTPATLKGDLWLGLTFISVILQNQALLIARVPSNIRPRSLFLLFKITHSYLFLSSYDHS